MSTYNQYKREEARIKELKEQLDQEMLKVIHDAKIESPEELHDILIKPVETEANKHHIKIVDELDLLGNKENLKLVMGYLVDNELHISNVDDGKRKPHEADPTKHKPIKLEPKEKTPETSHRVKLEPKKEAVTPEANNPGSKPVKLEPQDTSVPKPPTLPKLKQSKIQIPSTTTKIPRKHNQPLKVVHIGEPNPEYQKYQPQFENDTAFIKQQQKEQEKNGQSDRD